MHTRGETHIRTRLEEAATDIGRLRRRITNDLDLWTLDRVGCQLEGIYWMVTPTASELAAWHAPGDQEAIDEALRISDQLANRFQARLGLEQR